VVFGSAEVPNLLSHPFLLGFCGLWRCDLSWDGKADMILGFTSSLLGEHQASFHTRYVTLRGVRNKWSFLPPWLLSFPVSSLPDLSLLWAQTFSLLVRLSLFLSTCNFIARNTQASPWSHEGGRYPSCFHHAMFSTARYDWEMQISACPMCCFIATFPPLSSISVSESSPQLLQLRELMVSEL